MEEQPISSNTTDVVLLNNSLEMYFNDSSVFSWTRFQYANDSDTSEWQTNDTNDTLKIVNQAASSSFIPTPVFQAIIYTFYSSIFLLALTGNSFVCAILFTSVRKWSVTNYFIANMAAGDILMALFCIPFTFVTTLLLQYWPFGSVMCRLVSFSQAVSVFVSAYTMVAISGDRYLAIIYPLRPRMTSKQAKIIIVMVWLFAISTALPILLVSELIIPANSRWHTSGNRYVCQERWNHDGQQYQYTMALLILQYCLPLSVLLFTYGRIGIEIWGKKTPGEAHHHRDRRLAQSKRQMIKMMIIVVAIFAICWLPLNILQIVGDQYPWIYNWNKIHYVHFICHWLAMSHSACNPIIYCCFNSKLRKDFLGLAVRCGCSCLGGTWSRTDREVEPLQRVNTFTTYTYTGSTRSKGSCRVLLPVHHNGSVRFSTPETECLQPVHDSFLGNHRRQHLDQRVPRAEKVIFRSSLSQLPNSHHLRCAESHM